jgi:hypothetical protein
MRPIFEDASSLAGARRHEQEGSMHSSSPRRGRALLPAITLAVLAGVTPAAAQSQSAELDALRNEIEELRRNDAEKQRKLDELQRRLDMIEAQPPAAEKPTTGESALEEALRATEAPAPSPVAPQPEPPAILSRRIGGTTLRLIDISLDGLFAAGWSTETDESLQTLEGGGHDPRKRGFTIQNIELSFQGAVDPYLTGEAHLIFFLDPLSGESEFELEEAFLTTQSLPYGLQLEAGQFFTEFGLINPLHPHQWYWQDQPVINTRLFGPDGMRGPGFRLGWLIPVAWFSELHVGMQNANGETMASFYANADFFEERPIGGRPFVSQDVRNPADFAYLARWVNSWNLSPTLTGQVGLSATFGPNATGPDGWTRIYGTDLKLRWRPETSFRGWPFVVWETEVMGRQYLAASFVDDSDPDNPVALPQATLGDWGLYTQVMYGFRYRWAAGLRFEYATGYGESVPDGREADPFRDDRYRISPLLLWQPSEFSRFRLQYNYDHADHLARGSAHSVWVGAEFLYGAHPAHKY